MKTILEKIREQTGRVVIYNDDRLTGRPKVVANFTDTPVEEVLSKVLQGSGMTYKFVDEYIVIVPGTIVDDQGQVRQVTIRGTVREKDGTPLPGVTILLKGTESTGVSSGIDGKYSLTVPTAGKIVLQFSFIGMVTREVEYAGEGELDVVLEESTTEMEEVVVVSTGMFERGVNSFTGSFASYRGEDLKRISTQNVLVALKTLDPAFRITPNNQFGSDPNKMPDIDIRGKASVINMEAEFCGDPNLPLFILDGFEVSLETVVDLDMERVSGLVVLKDAASTAMYGSRAANGVIVIETKRPRPGKLDFRYNGVLTAAMPDLTVYNMMNAAEKLEFERLTGYYDGTTIEPDFDLKKLYNKKLAWVQSGVNTYWLSEPVRVGLTNKHSATATGGTEAMYYSLGVDYASNQGVMKQSGRNVLGFNVNMNYRATKVLLNDIFTVGYTTERDAPESFETYLKTNPYYPRGSTREPFLDEYTIWTTPVRVSNPLYNASQNYLSERTTLELRNNFKVEFFLTEALKLSGKVNITKTLNTGETFKSPYHTDYANVNRLERGSYTKSTRDRFLYSGDFTVTYGRYFDDSHQVNIVGRVDFSSSKSRNDAFTAIGFPDDLIPNPSFANRYALSSKPSYGESLSRSVNYIANLNYSFKDRYALDVNLRGDGSTNFGRNRKYTTTYSLGVAWNIHRESFASQWADRLKLRFSYGNPGNNNFSLDTDLSYKYNTSSQNVFGVGANVNTFSNENLDWQKTRDMNLGLDIAVFNNRFTFNTDVYRKVTDPLLVQIDVAPSTGSGKYITNFGRSEIRGYTFQTSFRLIKTPATSWTVHATGSHYKTTYSKIGNRLASMNTELQKSSLKRFRDGYGPDDIWAVPSAGIDPVSGEEIFIRRDNSYTFVYNAKDEVVVGNTQPALTGTVGTTVAWKSLTFSAYLRYSVGADYYNEKLYERIENITREKAITYNQDKRALYDRWQKPGDRARYRNIVPPNENSETYRAPVTDRYVQRENYLKGESFNLTYDFRGQPWLGRVGLANARLSATLNEAFEFSTVRAEKGITYPFNRSLSFALNVTFK
ncbi:MAG: SusC/RagA family TonB-linked outer membrane protein [Odoribacteraceae bacterium]|jgi:TonB-linked SusC/RagA family outer membrane protein|nr:SusC/RagA family TonB-linked outer membrane protein [Odoribacteraceae bacterium]